MSISKFPFLPKPSMLILFFVVMVFNLSFSQNSLMVNSPLSSVAPRDFFAFSNQALGISEFAYENSFRDLFVHPGKTPINFKASAWASYSRFENVYNYSLKELTNENMNYKFFENFEYQDYKNIFPIGFAVNLDILSIGLIYGSGNMPYKFEDIYYSYHTNNLTISESQNAKGKVGYFKIALGLNLYRDFNVGVSYSNQNHSMKWKDSYNYNYYLDFFSPSEITLGASYSLNNKLKFYLAYNDYKMKYERGSNYQSDSLGIDREYTNDYQGKVLNLDIRFGLTENLNLYSRMALDLRNIKINDVRTLNNKVYKIPQNGDATNYRFGLGANYRVGNVNLITEFNYEPGRENVQIIEGTPGSWDPYITGNDRYFKNWNFAFAMEAQVIDALKLQTGIKFYKTKIRLIQEFDWYRNINIDPYRNFSNSFITAGFEFRIYDFILNYIFNYSTEVKGFYPGLVFVPGDRFTEYNPLYHNFVLRYEIK